MSNRLIGLEPVVQMPTAMQKSHTVNKNFTNLIEEIPQKPYFKDENYSFVLYHDDCLKILSTIPSNSVDLIFADPPYFLSNGGFTCHAGKMVSVNKGSWDKSKGIEGNHEFNKAWLKECQRILTHNGTIWVSGTSHVIHSIGFAMQQLGFKLLNDIVWFKINPPPNLSCRYFTHSTETIIWAAKNTQSKHTYNYQKMKAVFGKQMKNIWPDLLYDWLKDTFDESFWSVMPPKSAEKIYGKHPTQKPIQLLDRIVLASSKKGDIILDPFNGSGTTGIAAYREGRKYIGIELDEEYLKVSIKRLKDEFSHSILSKQGTY